jgi:hypothetical protein
MSETHKIRSNLTVEELERLQTYGSLNFKSIPGVDMRVEKLVPRRTSDKGIDNASGTCNQQWSTLRAAQRRAVFWKGQRWLSQYVALQMRLRERDSSSG